MSLAQLIRFFVVELIHPIQITDLRCVLHL
jgi:hypothetical protein